MAHQLIYTSVRRGLIPGRSGYTVAARHRQIRERLVADIERVSGYTYSKAETTPIIYAHRKLSLAGTDYHLLTRIVDAGSDYTGRTNHLAHHLVCEDAEIAAAGATPAEVLAGFRWLDSYDEEPRYLEDSESVDLASFAGSFTLPAKHWKGLRGQATDAALLLEDQQKPAGSLLVTESGNGREMIDLIGDSMALLAEKSDPWAVTFTTYLQQGDSLGDFTWAGCAPDHAILQRPARRRVLELSALSEPTPSAEWAKLAETGVVAAPKPPPSSAADVPAPSIELRSPARQDGGTPKPAAKGERKQPSGPPPPPTLKPATEPSTLSTASRTPPTVSRPPAPSPPRDWNLKIWIPIAAAVLLLAGLLMFYLSSIQPWQRLNAELRGHLGHGEFREADRLLDEAAKKRSGWREKIAGLRRGVVIETMQEAAEEHIEGFARVLNGGGPAHSMRRRARTELQRLDDYSIDYASGNTAIREAIDSLDKRLLRLETRHDQALELARPGPTPDPGEPPKPDTPPKPVPEIKPPVQPPAPAAKIASSIYLFLNHQLSGLSIPQSLPDLVHGESGQRRVTIGHKNWSNSSFPPRLGGDAGSFDFKFPETADEEGAPLLPRGGGLNVELKFQGGVATTLLKNDTGLGASGTDIWQPGGNVALGFASAPGGLQLVLWNGLPLAPAVPSFVGKEDSVSLHDDLASFLAALKTGGKPEARVPRELMLRFTPPPRFTSVANINASDKMPLPLVNPSALSIDFSIASEKQEGDLAGIAKQIAAHQEALGSGGEYFDWRKRRDRYSDKLRGITVGMLGADHALLDRHDRFIQQPGGGQWSYSQLKNFCADLVKGFVRQLSASDIDDDDLDTIEVQLLRMSFWAGWRNDKTTAEEFATYMAAFAGECRDLGGRKRNPDGSVNRLGEFVISDESTRPKLVKLGDLWEETFAGKAGAGLWTFAGQSTPEAPDNLREVERAHAQLPALLEREAALRLAREFFGPLRTGGLPPGRYELFLGFADGKLRPLVVTDTSSKRSTPR